MEERYGKVSLMGHTIGNWDEVMVEYQKLEDEGFAEASVALGQLELSNRNKYKALEHFRKAASAGVAEGAWGCAGILGHDYIADVTYTDKEWYSYCMQAALGGCCDAMNELAICTIGRMISSANSIGIKWQHIMDIRRAMIRLLKL